MRAGIHPPNPGSHAAAILAGILVLSSAAVTSAPAGEGNDQVYGPCRCQPRGTLFQWSYGTSFSGGPDLEAPLVTDRPDFTEASSTVGRGVVQLEMGYTYGYDSNDAGDTTETHSYPEALFRVGVLADWLELRIGWTYGQQIASVFETAGAEDLYLGFKIGMTPQEGWLPEMALIPQTTIPTGADSFTADEALPGLNWTYSWELSDFISTAGSTQFNRTLDNSTNNAYTEWAQSWTVGYRLTECVGAYTEWYTLIPHSADSARTEQYFDGGFTVLLNNNIQWDVLGGAGLNDAAEDYFVGTGLSIRFR